MDGDAIRAFARRPWTALEASKRDYWAAEFARCGSRSALQASLALWEHVRNLHPDWPTEAQREEDFAHHVRLKALLDRTRDGVSAR